MDDKHLMMASTVSAKHNVPNDQGAKTHSTKSQLENRNQFNASPATKTRAIRDKLKNFDTFAPTTSLKPSSNRRSQLKTPTFDNGDRLNYPDRRSSTRLNSLISGLTPDFQ